MVVATYEKHTKRAIFLWALRSPILLLQISRLFYRIYELASFSKTGCSFLPKGSWKIK